MKRYYVVNSSMFDKAPFYKADFIAAAVKELNTLGLVKIQQVRKAKYNGWFNQPQVVCFNAEASTLSQIAKRIKFVLNLPFEPIISEKHW